MDSRISIRWISACGALVCAAGALILGTSARVHRSEASIVAVKHATSAQNPAQLKLSNSASVQESYGKLALAFEPNQGQTDDTVKFLARGNGYTLFLTPAEAVFAMRKGARGETLRMNLENASPNAKFAAEDELPGKSNYLIGNDRSKWRTNVPNYRAVRESKIYPGIDLVFYGNQRQLEYDFVVAPSADPRAIELAFSGVEKISANSNGDLNLSAKSGAMLLHKPVAYQDANGAKNIVPASFVVKGRNRVAVKVGKYDPMRPLVIDPVLAYSTYLGGSGIDGANGIAVAPDGTAFVAGGTSSTNFPTAHPLQPNAGGPNDFPQDAFVSKFSADGSTLLYSTYLGGSEQDVANGIAVDAAGNAYVVGTTLSADFPVTPGSFNTECGGDGACGATLNSNGLIVSNGFLTKLNAAGSALVYSGFIGEYENVTAQGVAVDLNQIAYVTGKTAPNGTPTSTATFDIAAAPAGAVENSTGTAATITTTTSNFLQVNTTVTISGVTNPAFDGTFGVITVINAKSFVVDATAMPGATSGGGTVTAPVGVPPFPITGSAFQAAYGGGPTDAYVMAVSATGSTILYSTYAGGENEDTGYGISVDNSGNAYVTGLTYSTAFPITASALQTVNEGEGDAFALKVSTTLSGAASLVYSTYLGGSGLDKGNGVAVDSAGNMYVTGGTSSTASTLGFTIPPGAFQSNCALDSSLTCEGNVFVAKIDPAGTGAGSLIYFTYIGGSMADSGAGIAVDSSGDAYVTGSTVSTDYPTTPGVFQPTYGGGNDDAFVTEVNPSGSGLVYSSYLGGSNTDNGYGIALDTSGDAFVAGQTCSVDFPLDNPEQPVYGGNCDAFVSKVSSAPGITIAPAGLVFPDENIGTASPVESVTINNGSAAVTISGIAVIGTNAADFAATTTCAGTLPASSSCTISAVFTASIAGAETAAIEILDSAPGSPQYVNLSGTGLAATPTFTLGVVPPTATVNAGASATYQLTITSVANFSNSVSLACSGAPQAGSCSITPGFVTPGAGGTSTAYLKISTGARTLAPPVSPQRQNPLDGLRHFGPGWFALIFALMLLTAMTSKQGGRRAPVAALGFALTILLMMTACGGGGPAGVPNGTPAGTYTVTVTGTSGSLMQTSSVTINVN